MLPQKPAWATCPVRRSVGGATRRDSFAGQCYPVCPRSGAQLGAHAQMPQPAAPSGGASGQPLSWLPGTGRAPAPTSPRADPVSWSWFLCASCLRKPPWKTQTHDSWVDKYACFPKGAGRGWQRETVTRGPTGPGRAHSLLSMRVHVDRRAAHVHVFACMHDCLCLCTCGEGGGAHSRLLCGPGLQASDPPPVKGWRQAQQGEGGAHQARGEPACPQQSHSSESWEQCRAPHVTLTLMHELLPQRKPEEMGGGGSTWAGAMY